MSDYYFFYKDSIDKWCTAKNPIFISSHKKCRAIKKSDVLKIFNSELQLINKLNSNGGDEEAEEFVRGTILSEIK